MKEYNSPCGYLKEVEIGAKWLSQQRNSWNYRGSLKGTVIVANKHEGSYYYYEQL